MLVRDCHDNADRNEEHAGNAQRQEETIPRKMDRVVFDNKDSDSEHSDKGYEVPVHRCILISSHQAYVHVITATHYVLGISRTGRRSFATLRTIIHCLILGIALLRMSLLQSYL